MGGRGSRKRRNNLFHNGMNCYIMSQYIALKLYLPGTFMKKEKIAEEFTMTMNLHRKMNFVFILLLLLLGLLLRPDNNLAQAYHSVKYESSLKFEHLGIDDGLSQADVRSIAQDPQGFMWFGTLLSGLNRYDGYGFKVFQHDSSDSTSISNNCIWVLYVDKSGTLWIGTNGGGLNKYIPETENFLRYTHDPNDSSSIADNSILSIYEDKSGTLWIGTNGGLSRLDKKTEKFITYKKNANSQNGLNDNSIRSIHENKEKTQLWLGTENGINIFDLTTGIFSRMTHNPDNPNSLSDNYINCIYCDNAGFLWIATGKGLDRFDEKTNEFIHFGQKLGNHASNNIWKIHEDHLGRLWITTSSGAYWLDVKTWKFTKYQKEKDNAWSLSDNNTWSIFEDRTGGIWISTTNNGVNRVSDFSNNFFSLLHNDSTKNDFSEQSVNALLCDKKNNLWIGTTNGVIVYDGKSFKKYQRIQGNGNSLSSNQVQALAEDSKGNIWIGTIGGGINCFDGKKILQFKNNPADQNSIAGNDISSLCADKNGGLWIGVHGVGLDYWDGKKFAHFKPNESIPGSLTSKFPFPLLIFQDNLWLGSDDKGLIKLDLRSYIFDNYPLRINGKDFDKMIFTAYVDEFGEIWAGGSSGLFLFDSMSESFIKNYTKSDGLPSNVVVGIKGDKSGNLWVSTTDGLSRFDSKENEFKNFDESDGLERSQFNLRSICTADGIIYLGSNRGVNYFYPDKLTQNPNKPPVVITAFELFNRKVKAGNNSFLKKSIEFTNEIKLNYSQSFFSFEFAGLDFTAPKKNLYAYRMEGFDKDWNYTDANRRSATYTNLNPGTYNFHVKASNNDGVWNEQGASIKIVITPPIWQTWWFRGISVVLIGAVIFAGFSLRLKNIRKRGQEFERLVVERTAQLQAANKELEAFSYSVSHDLRTPLRGIDGFSQILLDEFQDKVDEQGKTYLHRIRSAAQHMAQLIDDMLNLSRVNRAEMTIQQVNLSEMAQEVADELQENQAEREVEFIIQEDIKVLGDSNLLRIVLENLIENAWKYTSKHQKARVEFGMQLQKEVPVYFIRDDGAGFNMEYVQKLFGAFQRLHTPTEFPGTGVGLATVQRIIHRHGGKVWAEGEVEKGATFYFTIAK